MVQRQNTNNWVEIFKSDAIRQVIYLCIFVGIILGVNSRIDFALSSKYASASELKTTKEDVDDLKKSVEKLSDNIEENNNALHELIGRMKK